jgi:hypothetical protein
VSDAPVDPRNQGDERIANLAESASVARPADSDGAGKANPRVTPESAGGTLIASRWKSGLIVAALVFMLANCAGWAVLRNDMYHADGRVYQTHVRLQTVRGILATHKKHHGNYPRSLTDLPELSVLPKDKSTQQLVDLWNNPVHYKAWATGYQLLSYGRDGLLDGAGLDTDLDGLTPLPPVTLRQYLLETSLGSTVFVVATFSGGLSFALWMLGVGIPYGPTAPPLRVFGNLIALVLLSVIAAVAMSVLHLSGH